MVIELEQGFRLFASYFALGIEAAAILTVAIGAIEAFTNSLRNLLPLSAASMSGRAIWVRFATWILLSLEFTLGADIIRTAIAPTWDEIGKLAAIAAIRTALNYFLGRDVEQAKKLEQEAAA